MHIGLIGGIGPAATEHYYRCLIAAHEAAGKKLDLTIVHAETSDLVRNMGDNNPQRQAEIFLPLVQRLEGAGAEAAAITSMTGHFCVNELTALSPLPVISALPAVNAAIAAKGLKRVGILGTRLVMGTRLYGAIDAAEIVVPEGEDFEACHDAYLAMAFACHATDSQRSLFFEIGQRLCDDQGAEAVILGGTDLFLAFDGRDCGFDVIDCAQIHAEALTRL